jgi:molybdate transport system ATP-binding protein
MSVRAKFTKQFSGFTLDADLDLPGKGVSAIFGDSGSGKTTLLRCVAGLERADSGFLEVNGALWQDDARGIFLPTHRRALGMVFQESSLFPHLSVRANLEFGWKRVAPAQRQVAFDEAVALLDIGHLLERMPANLSGGERQRAAIVRALLTSPALLLMDEPLASLDSRRKQEILPYLERLHDELAIPVLYVSHSSQEVARLADMLVLLERGKVAAAAPLEQLLPRLDLPFAHSADASVVIPATVAAHDDGYGLSRVEFDGGAFWVGQIARPLGARVRVNVAARDVSIALARPRDSSILNSVAVNVLALDHDQSNSSLIQLAVGETRLLARVMRKSAVELGLAPGMAVHAQVKGVALLK